jgi:hypothetical protein
MRVKGSFKIRTKNVKFLLLKDFVYMNDDSDLRQKDRNVGIYFEGEEFVWIIYIVEFVLIETCLEFGGMNLDILFLPNLFGHLFHESQ